jgi:hypothetical protein
MTMGKRTLARLCGAILGLCACGSASNESGAGGASGTSASGSGASGASGSGASGASGSGSGASGASGSGSGASGAGAPSGASGSGAGGASSTGTSSGSSGTSGSGMPSADAGIAKDAGATSGGDASSAGGKLEAGSGALIQNDVFWKDTSGNLLSSQGGGIIQVGNTFYWYGVQYAGAATYAASPTALNSDTTFVAVTCYSSTDLAHWKFEGNALTAASIGATGWVGRVGVAYNPTTKMYVLVTQYTGSHGAGELFATSSTPSGAFTFDNVQATLTNVVNNGSGDQSVFTDDDGQAYLVFSNVNGRSDLYVAPLRPADFLAVQPATRIYASSAGGREGNCMYKYNGHYYFNSSDLHGWNASHTYSISATNILGPYSTESVLGNTDADFSHVTQTGLFVMVHGSAQTTIIFGGDRWSDFAGNGIGYNQWVPLTFNGTAPQMQSLTQWSIDVASGSWSVGPGNNYALNPSFEADRVAMAQPAGWIAGGDASANATGGHTGRWKWRLSSTAAYQSSLTQSVTGLPNGTYTLAAWIESSGGQSVAQIFATGFGGATVDASVNTAMASWSHVSVPGIVVTNGTCQIGVQTTASAAQWVNVDDVTLTKN